MYLRELVELYIRRIKRTFKNLHRTRSHDSVGKYQSANRPQEVVPISSILLKYASGKELSRLWNPLLS